MSLSTCHRLFHILLKVTDMNRRRFLGVIAGLGPPLAGCLGSETPASTPTDTPASTPTSTPTEPCQRDLKRIEPWWTVESGPLDGFDLSLSTESVSIGGTLTANLRNVTDEQRTSGTYTKYDIERQTAAGWESIFWKKEYEAWTSEGVFHEPDEGFNWEFTFTQDGLTETGKARPDYFVCSSLEPGTYRFVYWGVSPEGESGTDYALSSQFSVTQD